MQSIVRSRITVIFSLVAVTGYELAFAQPFPNRNLRIVVPFPPGGTSDFLVEIEKSCKLIKALGLKAD